MFENHYFWRQLVRQFGPFAFDNGAHLEMSLSLGRCHEAGTSVADLHRWCENLGTRGATQPIHNQFRARYYTPRFAKRLPPQRSDSCHMRASHARPA
jgi:hypothetical protein